jgi:hypothetical protein
MFRNFKNQTPWSVAVDSDVKLAHVLFLTLVPSVRSCIRDTS